MVPLLPIVSMIAAIGPFRFDCMLLTEREIKPELKNIIGSSKGYSTRSSNGGRYNIDLVARLRMLLEQQQMFNEAEARQHQDRLFRDAHHRQHQQPKKMPPKSRVQQRPPKPTTVPLGASYTLEQAQLVWQVHVKAHMPSSLSQMIAFQITGNLNMNAYRSLLGITYQDSLQVGFYG